MSSDDYDEERPRRRRRRRRSSSSRRYREEEYDRDDGGEGVGEDGAERPPREEYRRPEVSLRVLIGWAIALFVLVMIGGGGWYFYRITYSPEALAFAEARKQPLLGMVIQDQPGAESRLRAAVEQDLRQPNKDGVSREAALVAELRSANIAPTLRRADDASLIAAMAARAAFVDYLARTDTAVCREFGLGGLQHPEKLDAEGQRLFKSVLAAVETAYRNGRSVQQTPPMPNLAQVGNMLVEAGFIKSDFDKLNSFATLSNDVTCYIVLKINQVPDRLKPEERGPYSRYVLGN